ncbi:response regulator [Bosea sp. BK604]|uniref:sensor histidine kinase n=1 Tax=Bosea sp. BK604 TaxID=2512180 RepID=UPI001052FC91|nr:response regulator [Bosea sp. BK604]TCR62062.1 two-component sensor histidine kinase [Bosea sp. BK604]
MPNRQIHILYIDDDAALGRLVEKTLARRGYQVESATDATVGLARVDEQAFDVVILDHDLGTTWGLDVLASLRERPTPPPVVYVTASSEITVAVQALKAGAVDYVLKTVGDDFDVLLNSAIEQALDTARLRRDKERAERELRQAHDRAVTLLAEVNHRVANSLALVGSLVRMQAAAVSDTAAKHALAETQGRIAAIGSLHRRLYTSDDVRSVDVGSYLEGLVGELSTSMTATGRTPSIRTALSSIELPTDKAVSVGMVVTELVTNAVKYAYPAGDGEVRVLLSEAPDGGIDIVVEDDGIGWRGVGVAQGTGLGGKVIAATVRNLSGDFSYESAERGTRARLRIPLQ